MSLRNRMRYTHIVRCWINNNKQKTNDEAESTRIGSEPIAARKWKTAKRETEPCVWRSSAPFRTLMPFAFFVRCSCGFVLAVHFSWWDRCLNVYSLCVPHAFFTFISRPVVDVSVCVCEFMCVLFAVAAASFSVHTLFTLDPWLDEAKTLVRALDSMQARIPFLSRLGRSVCLQFVVWPVLFFTSLKRVASQQEK